MSDCGDEQLAELVAEHRTVNERLVREGQRMPLPGMVSVERLRHGKRFNSDGTQRMARSAGAIDRELHSAVGAFKVRVFPSADSAGLYVHFHGGGWALGSIYEQDELLEALSRATRLTVVSVDYPLAPEHGLQTALATAVAAARTVVDAYQVPGFCLGGESAGAHVAVMVALQLAREEKYSSKLCGLNLCYGVYDLSMTPSQRLASDTFVGLSRPYLEWFYSLTLPGLAAEERRDPAYSPLYRDVAHMPGCMFSVGELDPVLDDTLFMASRWRAAGNATELHVYPQAHHGFNGLNTRLAKLANARIHTFLANCIEERRS